MWCWAHEECDAWVVTFLAVGKPVFVQEYGDDGAISDDDHGNGVGDGTITGTTWRDRACPDLQASGFAANWIEGLALDGDGSWRAVHRARREPGSSRASRRSVPGRAGVLAGATVRPDVVEQEVTG